MIVIFSYIKNLKIQEKDEIHLELTAVEQVHFDVFKYSHILKRKKVVTE